MVGRGVHWHPARPVGHPRGRWACRLVGPAAGGSPPPPASIARPPATHTAPTRGERPMSEGTTKPPRVRHELADETADQPPAAAVRAGRKAILPRLARAPEFGAAVAAVLLYAFFALAAGSNGF